MPQHDSKNERHIGAVMTPASAIAGPRRARAAVDSAKPAPTAPPPLPKVIAPPPTIDVKVATASPDRGSAAVAVPARVQLPSLDYEDIRSKATPVKLAVPVEPKAKPARRCPKRLHWFGIGLVLGTIAALGATGELGAKLRAVRAELAMTIRSMKRHPLPTNRAAPAPATALAATTDTPCTEEDCALLLAPFRAASFADPRAASAPIPLVNVNDLPKAKPRFFFTPPPAQKPTEDVATGNTSDPNDAPPAPADSASPQPPNDPPPYENGPVASLPAAP